MDTSRQSLEILLDLVEIKLGALLVQDKEDMQELSNLKSCKRELAGMIEGKSTERRQRHQRVIA
ncbi:MAG: hypothetical protein LBL30_01820 [Holosporales bacterium]|jgi:hypothetical protein|nr:hypothetical protein [Holosporales bacterium]